MYKLLIVDDEWLVREGLKQTIPWKELGCHIVGEASNGQTALELIQEYRPDIVLSDIRMPKLNGIELARAITSTSPTTNIIFLTGYGEFSYAQEAIKLGVVDFVLKPTDPDELIKVIGRVTKQIDEERKKQALVIEKVLTHFLDGHFDDENIQLLEEILGRNIREDITPFHIAIVQWEDEISTETFHNNIDPLIDLLAQSRKDSLYGRPVSIVDHTIALLVQGEFTNTWRKKVKSYLSRSAEQKVSVAVGISNLHDHIEAIPEAYKEAALSLQQKLYLGDNPLIFYTEIDHMRLEEKYGFTNIEAYIQAHFQDDLSLKDLATMFHMSESHFSRIFKKYTGLNFIDYVTQLRIEKAQQLLLRPGVKVYEVAVEVGYSDPQYFSQVFRKLTGQTPREFRAKYSTF